MIGNHANFDGNFTSISIEITLFRIILIRKENKRNNEKDFFRTTALCNAIRLYYGHKQNQKILSWMQISFKNFFRILMQKGIENYDKAIEALEKPIKAR
jgi:hypothetical protein